MKKTFLLGLVVSLLAMACNKTNSENVVSITDSITTEKGSLTVEKVIEN